MLVKNVGLLSLSTLTVFMLYTESARALTPDVTVQYNLRATPGDPLSDITHRVVIGLFEESRDGDNVGWEARILAIHELDENGDVAYRWSKAFPTVDTIHRSLGEGGCRSNDRSYGDEGGGAVASTKDCSGHGITWLEVGREDGLSGGDTANVYIDVW